MTAHLPTKKIVKEFFLKDSNGYKCTECQNYLKHYETSLTNLKKHVVSKHLTQLKKLYNHYNIVYIQRPSLTENINQNNTKVTTVLVQAIIKDIVPLSVIESPFFSTFCSSIIPKTKIPSSNTIKNKIILQYQTRLPSIITNFKNSLYYSLSIDIWANKKSTVIGILGKRVEDNLSVYNQLLLLKEIENQKSITIKECVINFLRDNNLGVNNLSCITVDSCPAMKLFQKLICEELYNTHIEEYLDSPELSYNLDLQTVIDMNENNRENLNVEMINCSVHLLQLVIKKSLQNNTVILAFINEWIKLANIFCKKSIGNIPILLKLPLEIR